MDKPLMAISDLAKRVEEKLWQKCLVCDTLETLPDVEAAALKDLLANPRVRYSELSKDLAEDADYPTVIPADTLARHAKGNCSAREVLRVAKRER